MKHMNNRVKACTRYKLELLVNFDIPDATKAELTAALSATLKDHLPYVDSGTIGIFVVEAT